MTAIHRGLFVPPDLLEAHVAWKANCGPGALAAVVGLPAMRVREACADFPGRPWMTPTSMQEALTRLRVRFSVVRGWPHQPMRGLAFVQLRGTWDEAPVRVQYTHTHWIGYASTASGLHLYDVNAGESGGWLPSEEWKRTLVTAWVARHPRASGKWWVRTSLEVVHEAA